MQPRKLAFTLFLFLLVPIVMKAQSANQSVQTSAMTVMPAPSHSQWMTASIDKMEQELVAKYGEGQRARVKRGLGQVANFWRSEDGDAASYEEFVRRNFAGEQAKLDEMFNRFEWLSEKIGGHMNELTLAFRWQSDLDIGPILPFDEIFAGYNPGAHITDDFFKNKLAFVVLLNFPLTTLNQRLSEGATWTRRQWADARLAQGFAKRIPAEVNQAISEANAAADQYIAEYNIWMHHVVDDQGNRPFPPKMKLLAHWNLRDEIKAQYAEPKTGLPKQRTIQKIMERIVTQTIPAIVVNNPHVDWNPFLNTVKLAATSDVDTPPPADLKITSDTEPDRRYATLLGTFIASRKADPYSPTAPTLIARRFDEDREIPEPRVKAMLEQVTSSPLIPKIAKLIEKRLGRPLEPFDIWYNGFRPRSAYTETQLDEIVSKKYPTPDAFEKDIPNILQKLGFTKERAHYLAEKIVVDPARGSGHAWQAGMRGEKAHLRTRVGKGGMNFKGFNIAIHELGHNVEQVFSLYDVGHPLLQGVPNTAFTEAFAFVFQAHDLELLGLASPDAKSGALKTLNDFWATYEIAGVALVDMAVWHWMYKNPEATPAQLKEATITIAKENWNKYFAPVFKKKDVVLLGIYSHMIHSLLYLPDYPIGHLIAHQIEEQMKKAGNIGSEFERMAVQGRIAPDLWMKNATGSPVGAEAMIQAAERALKEIE